MQYRKISARQPTAGPLCVAASLLVACFACDTGSNDRGQGPGQIEMQAARPGQVWAISKNAAEGANQIVFDEIPQTAAHIQGIIGARLSLTSVGDVRMHVQLNGDTGPRVYNTSAWQFSASGASGVLPGCGVGVGGIVLGVVDSESQYTFTISDYSGVDRKKDVSAHGWAVNGVFANNITSILSGGVRTGSMDAVHSLRFYLSNSAAGLSGASKITLYGLSDGP